MIPSNKILYIAFGKYCLDLKNRLLFKDQDIIPLAPKAFDILSYLALNRDSVVSKEVLLNKFWSEKYVREKNLTQHIYQIRKSLCDNNKRYIRTASKNGYQFVASVVEIEENEKTYQSIADLHRNLNRQEFSFNNNLSVIDYSKKSHKSDLIHYNNHISKNNLSLVGDEKVLKKKSIKIKKKKVFLTTLIISLSALTFIYYFLLK